MSKNSSTSKKRTWISFRLRRRIIYIFTLTLTFVALSNITITDDFWLNFAAEFIGLSFTLMIINQLQVNNDDALDEYAAEIMESFKEETDVLVKKIDTYSQESLSQLKMQSEKIDETMIRRRGVLTNDLEQFREQVREILDDLSRLIDQKPLLELEHDEDDPPTKPNTLATETQEIQLIRRDIEMIRRILADYLSTTDSDV